MNAPPEQAQLDIFGNERPTSEIPRMNCTGNPDCPAEVDEHQPGCPVEQELRDAFGF